MMEYREEARVRIGETLKRRRLEAGLTQYELAARTGIAQPNIARIEAGRYAVRFDILARVADALGCRVDIVRKEAGDGSDG